MVDPLVYLPTYFVDCNEVSHLDWQNVSRHDKILIKFET